MLHPFSLKSKVPAEITEREKDAKRITEEIRVASETARDILNSDKGKKYRMQLNEARDSIVEIMLRQVDPDPIKDAFFLRASLNKLAVIYDLLMDIEKDAEGV